MDRWLNGVKAHAGGLDMNAARTRIGVVESYDPTNAAVRVTIQPEGILSGWLPLGCAAIGGSAVIAPPSAGDQVVLEAQEGDAEQWIVTHRLFSAAQMPPTSPATSAPVQSGEVAIFHNSGAYLHFANNGTVYGSTPQRWQLTGDMYLTGNLNVTGNISDLNNAHGDLDELRQAYNDHQHPGVQSGGSDTGTTDEPVN